MRILSLLPLMMASLCLAAAPADEEENKKQDDKGTKAKAKPMIVMGQLTGKITEITEAGTRFVLEVEGIVPFWYRSNSIRSRIPPRIRTRKEQFDIDVWLAEEPQIRLPLTPDDAAAGSAKDKSDKLPGKPGTAADLKRGQIVTVTFAHTKEAQPRIYGTVVLVQRDRLAK
jgi:hypothetical protein